MANKDAQNQPQIKTLLWSQSLMMVISRLLVAVMLACLVVPVVLLVESIYPGWEGEFLIPLVFLVALEGLYSHYRLRGVSLINPRWWYFRAAELIVLLILIKITLYGLRGFDHLWIDLPLWRENFFQNFFSVEYFFVVLVATVIWVTCGNIEYLFSHIEGDEKLLREEVDAGYTALRVEVRRQLANFIIVFGGIMVVIVALMNLEAGSTGSGSQAVETGVIAIIVYFVLGLVLLSLTQFSILRVRWIINHIHIGRRVTTYWFVYSMVLILSLALLAILLPTGYSKQLLQVLQLGFAYFINFILMIYYLLATPFILFVGWLMSLFRLKERPVQPTPQPEIFLPPQITPGEPVGLWEFIKTILFWVTLIGLIVYAFVYYFRENPQYFTWIHRSRLFFGIKKYWGYLARWLQGMNRQIVEAVQYNLQRVRLRKTTKVSEARWNYLNPRRLSPRQQLLFYYLAIVQRGSEKGLPRGDSQTPQEYSDHLKKYLSTEPYSFLGSGDQHKNKLEPGSRDEIETSEGISQLTAGFSEARYSQHEISREQASLLRQYWVSVLKVLQKLK